MTEQFRPAPRPKNVFSEPKLQLRAPCPTPEGKGKFSTMKWDVFKNQPRLIVWTNCPNDTGEQNEYGKITAAMDSMMAFSLLALLGYMVKLPEGTVAKEAVANKTAAWDRNANRPGEPYETTTTWVGRDADGTIWISVKSKKQHRPVIKFPFKIPDFHDLRHGDGTPWSEGEKSQLAVQGYITMMEHLVGNFLVTNYVEPPPKEDKNGGGNRGGGGGGYQRGGNSGGGGGYNNGGRSNVEIDNDSDIPF